MHVHACVQRIFACSRLVDLRQVPATLGLTLTLSLSPTLAVGSSTSGRNNQKVPGHNPDNDRVDYRDEAAGLLHDTTVDRLADPTIVVTYHGAPRFQGAQRVKSNE